jgi:hypothetical protein
MENIIYRIVCYAYRPAREALGYDMDTCIKKKVPPLKISNFDLKLRFEIEDNGSLYYVRFQSTESEGRWITWHLHGRNHPAIAIYRAGKLVTFAIFGIHQSVKWIKITGH